MECTRLDDFIDERGISGIAYLEIDAQGKDLDVLKSLGDKIDIVERGHIEVPTSADVVLYKGQHLREETLNFLHEDNIFIDCIVTTETGLKLATMQASHQFNLYTNLEFPWKK